MTKPVPENIPKVLDAIVDIVLAYKPKPKSKPAKKRKRRAAKIAKALPEIRDQKYSSRYTKIVSDEKKSEHK